MSVWLMLIVENVHGEWNSLTNQINICVPFVLVAFSIFVHLEKLLEMGFYWIGYTAPVDNC